MAKKYKVIDSCGTVHTRTTQNRTYTHCVVAHIKAKPASEIWPYPQPAKRVANWAGSERLARKTAAGWTSSIVDRVEILPAVEAV